MGVPGGSIESLGAPAAIPSYFSYFPMYSTISHAGIHLRSTVSTTGKGAAMFEAHRLLITI